MLVSSKIGVKSNLTWVVFRGGVKAPLGWKLRNNLRWGYIKGWLAKYVAGPIANVFGVTTVLGELRAILYKADGSYINYGVVGRRVVTTAYCEFIVDEHQTESSEVGDFKFHDMGVGTRAENANETAIETVHGTGDTGSQEEESSIIYRSIGTCAFASGVAITEHVLMSQDGAGTLMDRTKFAAINGVSGDSIQFTYGITYVAGS